MIENDGRTIDKALQPQEETNVGKWYRQLVEERMKGLQADIIYYDSELESNRKFIAGIEKRKKKAELELSRLKAEYDLYNSTRKVDLGFIGNKVVETAEKKINENQMYESKIKETISDLYKQREMTRDKKVQRRIDDDISRKKGELAKIRNRTIKFSRRQRSILVAKEKIDKLKSIFISKEKNNSINQEPVAGVVAPKENSLEPTVTLDALKKSNNIITGANSKDISNEARRPIFGRSLENRDVTVVSSSNASDLNQMINDSHTPGHDNGQVVNEPDSYVPKH